MRKIRAIWGHRKPFVVHLRQEVPLWYACIAWAAVTLIFLALLLRDPVWVIGAVLMAAYSYVITFAALGVASYRRSLRGPQQDRYRVNDRNDIWKDRWPR